MITLEFNVTETEVKMLNKSNKLTSGNVEQIKCIFNFSEEYKGLIIRAVFNDEFRTVENNTCFAPELQEGRCRIGIYAYEVADRETTLRLSPIPCIEYINKGTYDSSIVEADKPTQTELEAHYALIKKLVDSGIMKGEKGEQGI